ncbi:MAG: hypothetical protein NTZ90_02170 [Proteobacteria bacterium]|jgi:hypothetical protein|nr:hypothetical protein [Pseudomonadota bacterium]
MSLVQVSVKQALTEDNYEHTVLVFRDRQAGVSEVYDPVLGRFSYNAYCLEKKLLKELFSCEYDFLADALEVINAEFGTWPTESFDKKGCGSCAAKK